MINLTWEISSFISIVNWLFLPEARNESSFDLPTDHGLRHGSKFGKQIFCPQNIICRRRRRPRCCCSRRCRRRCHIGIREPVPRSSAQ